MTKRERLDLVLVRRGLAETRERAQSLILAGSVSVGGQRATKPSLPVDNEADVEVASAGVLPYVSRGGLKLAAALDRWAIDVSGRVCLDIGASTGGFTDVMLQRGASRVYAVDVGYGQLHYRLRGDPRVVVMERTNVRTLEGLPERPEFASADVSFISLTLALPPVFRLQAADSSMVTLVKPQFEAGKGQVGKGGVVRDERIHRQVLLDIIRWSAGQPWTVDAVMVSPITGPAGNVEFLARWRAGATPAGDADVDAVLAEAAEIRPGTRKTGDNPTANPTTC